MSLYPDRQDGNAERVCTQQFVFATDRTTLASQPVALPT